VFFHRGVRPAQGGLGVETALASSCTVAATAPTGASPCAAATLMLEPHRQPRVIQEMLGHANISQTRWTTYSHVLPNIQQPAAERLDAMLG
jgi:integrase